MNDPAPSYGVIHYHCSESQFHVFFLKSMASFPGDVIPSLQICCAFFRLAGCRTDEFVPHALKKVERLHSGSRIPSLVYSTMTGEG
jgi:hypothetical protein